ncbi:hypothetical protein [Endozoicomonas ascidiicola]|uniref:hypothetical protein n=1 Tax=Endozoicomonas ascidiicola TaxID=1698521 RepID=UPI000A987C71|nr:hypothetical protein [Endozoicomonas ascidiicola]
MSPENLLQELQSYPATYSPRSNLQPTTSVYEANTARRVQPLNSGFNPISGAAKFVEQTSSSISKKIIHRTITGSVPDPKDIIKFVIPYGDKQKISSTIDRTNESENLISSLTTEIEELNKKPITEETKQILNNLYKTINLKLAFHQPSDNHNIHTRDILENALNTLKCITPDTAADSALNRKNNQLLMQLAILTYAHPDLVDHELLHAFLNTEGIPTNFTTTAIFHHLKNTILSSAKSFNTPLLEKNHHQQNKDRPLASFFESMGINISTDKNSAEKHIRRFDAGYSLILSSLLYIEEGIFGNTINPIENPDLYSHTLLTAAEFTKALSNNDLLLDKTEHSYNILHLRIFFKNLMKELKGDLPNGVFSSPSIWSGERSDLQRHLQAVRETFPNRMLEVFLNTDTSIKETKKTLTDSSIDISHLDKKKSKTYGKAKPNFTEEQKKINTENNKQYFNAVISNLRRKITDIYISCLDDNIHGLSKNLITGGRLFANTSESEESIANWNKVTHDFIERADELISDENIDKFDKETSIRSRVNVRRAIINGFSNIIFEIKKHLPENEKYLYNNCVAKAMSTLSTYLSSETPPTDEFYGKDKELIIRNIDNAFKKTKSEISNIISSEEKAYQENCIASISSFIRANSINAGKSEPTSDQPSMTMADLETYKNYLSKLVAIANSDKQNQHNDDLIATLTAGSKASKQEYHQPKISIHTLTSEEISAQIRRKKKPFNISRHTNNLSPAENFRTAYHFQQIPSATHNILKLSSLALQKSKLLFCSAIDDRELTEKAVIFFNETIQSLMGKNDLSQCKPFSILKNALNRILPPSDTKVQLIEDISIQNDKSLKGFNNFCGLNYNRSDDTDWKSDISEIWNALSLLPRYQPNECNPDTLKMAKTLTSIIVNSFSEAFSHQVANALPPSLEAVNFFQSLMAIKLTTSAPGKDNTTDDYSDFKIAIMKYNDHFKSLEEQMAYVSYNSNQDSTRTTIDHIEKTVSEIQRTVRNKAIQTLVNGFSVEQMKDPTVLSKISEELIKLSKKGFFEKHFSNSPLGSKPIQGLIKLLNKGEFIFLSGFFCVAVMSMISIKQGTDLMRSLQEPISDVTRSLNNLRHLFGHLTQNNPALHDAFTTIVDTPVPANFTASSASNLTNGDFTCLQQIYHSSVNSSAPQVSIQSSLGASQTSNLKAMRPLFYSDAASCPSGGNKSFPPGFINPGNAFSAVVSIITSAASMTKWGLDVSMFTESVRTHSSLPILFQELTADLNERVLTHAAHKQNPTQAIPDKLYGYNSRSIYETISDWLDTALNKQIPYERKLSLAFGAEVLHQVIAYFTLGPMGMAMPDRPHSMEQLEARVEKLGTQRQLKTIYRMLGYNTLKEMMDVFSTKSGTLQFLFYLKELDWFNTFNEKAGIANYLSIKTLHQRVTHALLSLSKKGSPQDTFQLTALENIYGNQLMADLLGTNPAISTIENEKAIKQSGNNYRVAGITGVMIAYAGQAFNLYRYAITPWQLASSTIEWLHNGTTNAARESMMQDILKAAQSTISREYDPGGLSDDQKFWHYIFGQRAATKWEQTAVLWFLKETINTSLFLNATANELNLGVTTRNWEILAATSAYLIKDTTGIMARLGTLMGSEFWRTMFSFLDKIDSPVAEIIIGHLSGRALVPPQASIEMMNSMLEEIIIAQEGDPIKIHADAGKKFKAILDIGVPTLNRIAKDQESEAQFVLQKLFESDIQNDNGRNIKPTENHYYHIANMLRDELEKSVPCFQSDTDDIATDKNSNAKQQLKIFINKIAPKINSWGKNELFMALSELHKIVPPETMDKYLNSIVRKKLRSLEPHKKNEYRKSILKAAESRRFTKLNESSKTEKKLSRSTTIEMNPQADTHYEPSSHVQESQQLLSENGLQITTV